MMFIYIDDMSRFVAQDELASIFFKHMRQNEDIAHLRK